MYSDKLAKRKTWILWVLLMQRAEITRMPEYDETVVLKSWPGRTMHLLFPRYASLETASGEPLLKASALWSLVDAETRRVVFPEKVGVEIEGVVTWMAGGATYCPSYGSV